MATVLLRALRDDPTAALPLVLLAPFPLDGRAWEKVAAHLTGTVLVVDPPGFGGDADGVPSLEGYARAVLDALDAAGVGRFVVAGNSMGGYTAMCLAELAPDRVAGLGLFGTKSTADADAARANRLAMAEAAQAGTPASELLAPLKANLLGASTKAARPKVVAKLDALVGEATASGVAWAQRAMAGRPDRTDVLAELGARGVPAVVVHGAEDALMDAASQEVMADALGVQRIEVQACGHLVPLEAPDVAGAALLALVETA